MRAGAVGIGAVLLVAGLLGTPVAAHDRDLMTVGGRVGPIKTGETTVAEMRDMFGDVKSRAVIRVGCSKVVRLRWGKIQTFNYRGENEIVDVKIRAEKVPSRDGVYRFHTRRGLRVDDSEARLRELYPGADGIEHGNHTHYILGQRGTKLMAKVIDGTVVELEAAPYEFC